MKKYSLQAKRSRQRTVRLGSLNIPLVVFAAGILTAAMIVLATIQTVTSSAKLAYLETEEIKLVKANQELTGNLLNHSSLTELAASAESLGFVKPNSFLYSETGETEVAKLP